MVRQPQTHHVPPSVVERHVELLGGGHAGRSSGERPPGGVRQVEVLLPATWISLFPFFRDHVVPGLLGRAVEQSNLLLPL